MPRRLLNLANDNRGKGSGLRAEATDADTTTVYVYDVIDGWWGVSAADFARELAAIKTPNVVLRINSPGGDVFEGRAMMAAIAEHPATFTARIDGLCASAATALTLPCNSVEIVEGGFYMIHQAWTFAMGNADDLRQTAKLLDQVDTVLVNGYVAKTDKTDAEVRALMAAESWFGAEEAVEAKFCDAVIAIPTGGKDKTPEARALAFNLAAFANAPKALTEAPEPDFEAAREQMLARLGLYERTAG
jgi:ATP-dependent Clp protease, protease subunit